MSINDDEFCNVDLTTISNYVLLLPELGEYGYTNVDTLSSNYIINSECKEVVIYMKLKNPMSSGFCY